MRKNFQEKFNTKLESLKFDNVEDGGNNKKKKKKKKKIVKLQMVSQGIKLRLQLVTLVKKKLYI